MKYLATIYPTKRFYLAWLVIACLFITGHFFTLFLILARISLLVLAGLVASELMILLRGDFGGDRHLAGRFSNGDPNQVKITLRSYYSIPVRGTIYEEIPAQFQKRDFKITKRFYPGKEVTQSYQLVPVTRGIYNFGHTSTFIRVITGLVSRRFKLSEPRDVAVYPSYYQLKKTELIALTGSRYMHGSQKLNRIGNNKEFEEIKEYVPGDDYRRINWKATARKNKLMVNQYQEERAQNVYQLIDMGRTMKMPFGGMTLLDYSINSALAIGNVILKKNDRAGLITYSDHLHSFIQADNKRTQIHRLLETLYAQETQFNESSLEQVYITLSRKTGGRSLIILYTNYESILGMERQLPLLKKLSGKHLVVMVSFINTELVNKVYTPARNIEDVYFKTVAEKNMMEKHYFMSRLSHYGIINLRVKPDELTLAVLNQYLEIKKQGLL